MKATTEASAPAVPVAAGASTPTFALVTLVAVGVGAEIGTLLLPFVFGALAQMLNVPESALSAVITLQYLTMAASAGAISVLLPRLNLRMVAVAALSIAIVGALATTVATSLVGLAAARVLLAVGEGAGMATMLAIASRAEDAKRTLAIVMTAVWAVSAAAIFAVPKLVSAFGPRGVFYLGAFIALLSIPFALRLPDQGATHRVARPKFGSVREAWKVAGAPGAMLLGSALSLATASIGLFLLVERIGVANGLSLQMIANVNAATIMCSAFVPLLMLPALRYTSRSRLLAAAFGVQIAAALVLTQSGSAAAYLISAGLLNMLYGLTLILIRTVMADLEPMGRLNAAAVAAGSISHALAAAAVAAVLSSAGGYGAVGWLAGALFLVGLILVVPVTVAVDRRRRSP